MSRLRSTATGVAERQSSRAVENYHTPERSCDGICELRVLVVI